MSDFDREAERERLREKYEQDREKRASTQRMSELLLRGATMTDSHCDTCGDPIFRYEGEEFCATCEAEDGADGGSAGQAEQRAESRGAGTREQERTPRDQTEAERATAEQTRPTAGERARDALANGAETGGQSGESGRPATTQSEDAPAESPPPRDEAASGDASSGPSEARAALVRTVTRFARRAEAADHPSEAVDYLAAAREAAEALAALDGR